MYLFMYVYIYSNFQENIKHAKKLYLFYFFVKSFIIS